MSTDLFENINFIVNKITYNGYTINTLILKTIVMSIINKISKKNINYTDMKYFLNKIPLAENYSIIYEYEGCCSETKILYLERTHNVYLFGNYL